MSFRSRRNFLKSAALAPFLINCKKASAAQPNIIFILADDLGWSDLGCYGNSVYETPNIDALARQAVRFNSAYSSAPVCAPPRASILTGKYPARIRYTNSASEEPPLSDIPLLRPKNVFPYLTRRQTTIAERLKQKGYKTGHIGKWDLGGEGHLPKDQGFDSQSGLSDQGDRAGSAGRLTDEAIRFLEEGRNERFFLNLWHYAVHTPLAAPGELMAKYQDKLAGDESRSVIYAAMVENFDQQIGRLLKKLNELGLASNTVVFFTSDNGGVNTPEWQCTIPTTNSPLRAGKGHIYEGGLRTPLIVRWPGVVKPDTAVNTPVISMDYHHTMAEMAGIQDELPKDGRSLVSLLEGVAPIQREALYWHFPHYSHQGGLPAGAILMENYKLIRFYETQTSELYNVRDDPAESLNLAAEMQERSNQMLFKLNGWLATLQAPLMIPNRQWSPGREREKLPWQKSCFT